MIDNPCHCPACLPRKGEGKGPGAILDYYAVRFRELYLASEVRELLDSLDKIRHVLDRYDTIDRRMERVREAMVCCDHHEGDSP